MVAESGYNSLSAVNLLLLIFALTLPLSAQIGGGLNETSSTNWGGNNYIAGTVFLPDGSPFRARIPIRLQSMTKGEVLSTTDDNGRFVFSRLSPGIYVVTVEGSKEFETVSQEVEVVQMRNSGAQTFTVAIRLRDKKGTEAKPGVVKVDEAKVPKKALEYYRKAVKLADSNERKAAIEQLKLAVAEYPLYMDAFNELGVQYMRLNELEKAAEALQQALKIQPEAFQPLVNQGILLFRLKKFTEAESVLRSALKDKKTFPVARYYLGRVLVSLAQYDEAEKEFKRAFAESEEKMFEVHRMLGNLYIAKGDNKRAIKELEIYLEVNPKAPDAEQIRSVISELKNSKSASSSPKNP